MSPALLQALPLLTRHWHAAARAAATLDEDIGVKLADVAGAALEQRPSKSGSARPCPEKETSKWHCIAS